MDDGFDRPIREHTQYSGILIEKMKRKHADFAPEMECRDLPATHPRWFRFSHRVLGHEMDIRDLKFDSDSFDVAIDKGTLPWGFAECVRLVNRAVVITVAGKA